MATHNIRYSFSGSGKTLEETIASTSTGVSMIDGETVATGKSDIEITFTLNVSDCKSFFLVSNANVTFETNSASAADDTIPLLADVPYVWHTNSYDTFLLGTDVTSVFITNASGATATINCLALFDATP